MPDGKHDEWMSGLGVDVKAHRVSMRLPEPEKPSAPKKQPAKPKGVVNMEPIAIKGDVRDPNKRRDLELDRKLDDHAKAQARKDAIALVVQTATDITQTSRINVGAFGQQTLSACVSFQSYAKPRLGELDDDEGEVAKFIMELGLAYLAPYTGIVKKLATGAFSSTFIDHMYDFAKKNMMKAASGDEKDDMEAAIQAIVQRANDTSLALSGLVEKRIVSVCDKVIASANAGKTLTGELTAFIEPFIMQTSSVTDALIEGRVGVPSPATSKQVHVQIYSEMVKKFERKLIIAKTSNQEKMKWNITGVPIEVERAADAAARAAAKKRESEVSEQERSAAR